MKTFRGIALSFFISSAALAEPVSHGDYVAVEAIDGTRWHLAPFDENNGKALNLRLVKAASTNGQTFVIEKVDLSDGPQVHDGNYIRLRGINSNYNNGREPYLMVEGGGKLRVNVSDKSPSLGMNDPTILFIRGTSRNIIYGAPFKIRGTHRGDNWLVGTADRSLVGFNQNEGFAASFIFQEPDAQMMKTDIQISRRSRKSGPFSQLLGTVFNVFSPNKERPACAYFTSCGGSSKQPLQPTPSGSSGAPTIRHEIVGSSLYLYIANASNDAFQCTANVNYQFDDFGQLERRSAQAVTRIEPHTADRLFWKVGSHVNIRLSDPVDLACNPTS